MNFVQPYVFWGLPLVALPILIHLLNRLRYRSVKWAAMMFLLSATKSSVRRARLRHYVILALRTLAILFLLLAIARPIAGGWLGVVAGGAPETVFLVLDRSASMEFAPSGSKSSRVYALEMFEEASRLMRGSPRIVLAESATLSVQEVPDASSLQELSLCGPTSASTDMPTLFAKILEYAVENSCGDMEIWVASDMQAGNWRIASPEWLRLKESFSALPQTVRIRVLSLAQPIDQNLMVEFKAARRLSRPGGDLVNVAFRLERTESDERLTVPVSLALEESSQQEDVEMRGMSSWLMRSLPLSSEEGNAGWGSIAIPADANSMDNRCYFTYGGAVSQNSVLVAEEEGVKRILAIASAPDPKGMGQSCVESDPASLDQVQWADLALLVWQAGEAGRSEAVIESFVSKGGTVVLFPPGRRCKSILGIEWGEIEEPSSEQGFKVVSWESMEGPLARTGDGKDLPVASLNVSRRQSVGQSDKPLFELRTYASYHDARPFLQGGRLGDGHIYVCTTLPSKDWSDLERGSVLVPMMQRLVAQGASRLAGADVGRVGMLWRDVAEWIPVDTEGKDPALDAGVYRIGGKLVALNVPEAEYGQDMVKEEDVIRSFEGMELEFVDSSVGSGKRNTASEIWPLFVFLMGAVLLAEAAMLSSERLVKKEGLGAGVQS